ncbi:MAG: hypothetical protein M3R15_23635 [Acidobacteriota bacterium]|nr:hypothetical protein [Acidobacteriota bacterium]
MTEQTQDVIFKDPDATRVKSFFGDEATEAARPVVPLTNGAATTAQRSGRGSWTLVLVLASAVIGSVLGVVGVHYFQNRRTANVTPAAHVAPSPVPPATVGPSPNAAVIEDVEASLPEPAAGDDYIIEDTEAPTARTTGAARDNDDQEVAVTRGAVDARKRDTPDAAARPSSSGNEVKPVSAPPQPGRKSERDDTEPELSDPELDVPEPVKSRPRRTTGAVRDEDQDTSRDDVTETEDEPGPRRIDRVRDIFTGARPRRENRGRSPEQRQQRRRAGRLPEEIFEGPRPR